MEEPPNKQLSLPAGLDQFAGVYMPARNFSGRTREEYSADLTDLMTFLAQKGITTWPVVGLRDLQHYLAELDRRRLAPASRNRKTYAIKTFFHFLHQTGSVRKDPAVELIPPSIPQKERRFLREDEYQAVLSEASSARDRAVLEVFLQTGLRLSELARLTLNDLDLPKRITKDPENVGFLKVRRKRGKEVLLPLNWKACESLSSWLKARAEMAMRGKTD
jgi:site-specific recombinase XerD